MPRISRRPSIKMQRLARELVRTGNGTQAAINAGYDVQDRHTAGIITSEYLSKPTFKAMVIDELEKHGATKTAAIAVVSRRMNDLDPKNAGISLRAALEVIKLWKECEMDPESESVTERHQILDEPLEVRRWFLLSGRMPTDSERKMLSALRDGEEIDPELLRRALGVKPKT